MYIILHIYMERDLFQGIESRDYGGWQIRNLQGRSAAWIPKEGSPGCRSSSLEAKISLPQGTLTLFYGLQLIR